jgi:hypothetical protein
LSVFVAAVLVERGDARSGLDAEVRGIVDEVADLDEVEEDGRVDGARSGGVVVAVGEVLEDLGRQLEPGAVEGRDEAPMPGDRELASPASASRSWFRTRDRVRARGRMGAHLLRQMMRAAGLPCGGCWASRCAVADAFGARRPVEIEEEPAADKGGDGGGTGDGDGDGDGDGEALAALGSSSAAPFFLAILRRVGVEIGYSEGIVGQWREGLVGDSPGNKSWEIWSFEVWRRENWQRFWDAHLRRGQCRETKCRDYSRIDTEH